MVTLREALVYTFGLLSGYIMRILAVDYEKKYEERKNLNEEVYNRVYNLLDRFSREWIFEEEAISELEQEWNEILEQKSRDIDDRFKREIGSFIDFMYEYKVEFDDHQSEMKRYREKGGNRDKNVRYYPALEKITPYILSSDGPDELHEELVNVHNRTEDDDLRSAIFDWEINKDENKWSEAEWSHLRERYDSDDIKYYDLDDDPQKYHHNFLNELYKQHRLCSKVFNRIDEVQKKAEERANKSIRFYALREMIIPNR